MVQHAQARSKLHLDLPRTQRGGCLLQRNFDADSPQVQVCELLRQWQYADFLISVQPNPPRSCFCSAFCVFPRRQRSWPWPSSRKPCRPVQTRPDVFAPGGSYVHQRSRERFLCFRGSLDILCEHPQRRPLLWAGSPGIGSKI